jgi:hypothetical protein
VSSKNKNFHFLNYCGIKKEKSIKKISRIVSLNLSQFVVDSRRIMTNVEIKLEPNSEGKTVFLPGHLLQGKSKY